MNDRELLELAAKAAGMCGHTYGNSFCERVGNDLCKADHLWNPLTDDGDALRLAHKFGLLSDVPVWPRTLEETRRAIVRAAAEIGRNMK